MNNSRRKKRKKNNLVTSGKMAWYYALSMLFAGLYLFGHINQLQQTIIRPGSGYLNATNLLLCLLGVCVALVPVLIAFAKYNLLKIDLYAISALYMVGNLWVIRWVYSIIASGDVSFDFAAYQLAWYNMFNHTIWASRNAETLILNYLSAVLWFNIARNIDKDKAKTCSSMFWIMVVTFVLPIVFFAVTRFRIIPDWWIKKSVTLFVSYAALFAAMMVAMQKKHFWERYIFPIRMQIK